MVAPGMGICEDTGVAEHMAGTAELGVDVYVAGLVHMRSVLEEQDAQGCPIAAACRSYVAFANFAGPRGGGYEATAGESTVRSPDGQVTARASGAPRDIAPAWLSEPRLVCGGQAADGCHARGSADRGPDWRSDRSAAGRPWRTRRRVRAALLLCLQATARCDYSARGR